MTTLRVLLANLGRRFQEWAGEDVYGETLIAQIKRTWL